MRCSVRHGEFLERMALIVRTERRALRWTQRELSRRAGVPQSRISLIERRQVNAVRSDEIDRLLTTLGVEYWLGARGPSHLDLRPIDLVHAKCSAFVDRRLRASGWLVAREVEVGGPRSRGWIDLLAYHPRRRMLLVIEVKTELLDLGAIERTIGWYELEAPAAARRLGWRPSHVITALLVLDSAANLDAMRAARDVLARAFPGRATALRDALSSEHAHSAGRFLASIDPRSRRAIWLRSRLMGGPATFVPYRDYADAFRVFGAGTERS